MANREEGIKKLHDLIKDINVAMLTTVDEDGSLRSRPMATQQTEFDGTLWFFTGDDAPKVPEVENEREVNVSYADPSKQLYVSVTGTATLVKDREKMEELWNPILKAWFKDGLDDPNLALLKVDVDRAQYWAPKHDNKFIDMIDIAISAVTGKTHEGQNEKLNLKS